MYGQTTIQITLVVKGEPEVAMEKVNRLLLGPITSWFVEDVGVKPPYPEGSLLWYRIDDEEWAEREVESRS